VANWTRFDLKNCCPDLKVLCTSISPDINVRICNPTTVDNIDGKIEIQFVGLYTKYEIAWSDNPSVYSIYIGNLTKKNLTPGTYTIYIRDLINKQCIWTYSFTINFFEVLDVELYYKDFRTTTLPRVPYTPITPFPNPDKYKLYWNKDRVLKRGTDGNIQCFDIVPLGGTPPYTFIYDDFLSYGGFVPLNLIPPSLPIPKQTNQNGVVVINGVELLNRPPIIINRQQLNEKKTIDEFCAHLAEVNGNGWVKITVTDSTTPNKQSKIIWLYLKQSPLA